MAQKMALINIVKTKIDFVRSQTDELHGLLDALINKETADAAAAVDSDKQDLRKVREINSRLDTVLDFLLEKCAEIDNFTSGSVVDFQQQHVKTSVPSSSSSSDNPQLFDRIEAVELAVSTFDQRMSELAQTKNQLEIRFNIMEETLEKLLTETANKEKAQSSTKGISEKKRKIHKNLGSSETERLEGIEAQVLYLLASKSDLSERLDSRIFPLKDLIKQIESELTGIKNSLQNKEQESLLLQKTNKDLTSDLDTLKNQCDQTVISLTDLSSKMDATEFTVNGSVACRINEENQIRELQDRISMVEEHKSKDMNYYTGKLEEVESLYKQLCQMVASKVNPLRHLQDILNKYHRTMEMQEETALQTKAVTADITDSSPGAGCLGSERQRVTVGFTAFWGDYTQISADTILMFTDVVCNEGNCYSSTTGYFTAPYNGLYMASLTLRQRDNGTVNAQVRLAKSRIFVASKERTVCKSLTDADKKSYCNTGVVRMKAGDRLFVRVIEAESKPRLSFYSGFSCILIG